MSVPRNTEPQANGALARALRRRNADWNDKTVHAERTNVIQLGVPGSGTAKKPDILVSPTRRQPVIVETEFAPARTVEQDATGRLGTRLHSTGADIEGVLSVVLPENLRTGDLETIERASFRYATHYLDSEGDGTRWPPKGEWLEGGVDDLADAIEFLSLSERSLALGTKTLEQVVRNTAELLSEHAGEVALARIATDLHQEAGKQTQRMAAAICVSAFVFHAAIEGQGTHIPQVPLAGSIDKGKLLGTWNAILEVNYWPIFSIARDLVAELPIKCVPPVMNRIAESVSGLTQLGATTYHDLTGRMFQTLITDRKFLATFYTLPESACLLAELAVERMDVDWSDRAAIEGLRIADFACGTGALLSAAQRAVYRRYRRAGGDDKVLHRALMERVLTGLDIMPAATHLTCSMLSSSHPSLAYGESQIHTMPYGIEGNRTHIGALDLLDSDHSYSLFATGESMGGTESESRSTHSVKIEDKSCDLVIMNPPFTRPTNHEAGHAEIPLPSFAGFNTSHDEQQAMGRKLKRAAAAFSSGNAGLASNFMDLGHMKLKEGGILALVIPFAFVRGKSWKRARETLKANYSDIHITSIASTGPTARAFSADTGMAECLVVATKSARSRRGRTISEGPSTREYCDGHVRMSAAAQTPTVIPRAAYSNLTARPSSLLEASVVAKNARRKAVRGDILNAGAAGVRSKSVIEVARGLEAGNLNLPRQAQSIRVPVVVLGTVATRGLVHRDINGGFTDRNRTGLARGPFIVRSLHPSEVPTYPMLWAHSADRERRFVVPADSCGDPRPGDEVRAAERFQSAASRLHANLDFRLNSQSLAMCLTPEKCLGGRAWPNVIPSNNRYEIPLLLWCNSTLGLIMHWWNGTRQQAGRSVITITAIPDLPVLDPHALTEGQLDHCHAIFEGFKEKPLLPANEAYRDETRMALDRELLFGTTSVLQLDPVLEEGLDLLRKQWCAEPSVHGGKNTRIES